MKQIIATVVVAVLCGAQTARAETCCDDLLDFTFGASFSYVYDLNGPNVDAADENAFAYANLEKKDEAFNVDLVQLGVSGERGNASYAAKIDFGDLAVFAGDAEDGDVGLQEAYLNYDFGPVLATAGRFPTPMGYEVLEPWGNANISRSRAWTQFMPISHDGVKLSGILGDFAMTLGVVNSTFVNDPVANDVNDDKGVVGSLGLILGDAAISIAGLYSPEDLDVGVGKDDVSILNVIVSGPIGRAHVALEGNWARDHVDFPSPTENEDFDFWNVVAYAGMDFGITGIDLRADYGHTDLPGIPLGEDDSNVPAWSITGTLSWALVDGVDLRVEYRHEDFATDFFADGDGQFQTDTQDVLQAQVVWNPTL